MSSGSSQQYFKVHNYFIGETIGKGSYSSIRICFQENAKNPFVAKVLSKRNTNQTILWNEGYLSPLLMHPNIVRIQEVIDARSQLFQISKFYEEGDLLEYLLSNSISLSMSYSFSLQLLRAVDYLHVRSICHRDIKLENILIASKDSIKLTDFGLACISFNGSCNGMCGSLQYVAPEVMQSKSYNGFKADIWSLGVVIFALFSKSFPHKEVSKEYDFQTPIDFSKIPTDLVPLISSMLSNDPSKRPTVSECLSIFSSKHTVDSNNISSNAFDLNSPIPSPQSMIVSRISQILQKSTSEVTTLLNSNDQSVVKLLYILYEEKERTKEKDSGKNRAPRCNSWASSKPSLFGDEGIIVKKFAADSYSVLTEIRKFLEPINGCISNPTTRNRHIVLNKSAQDEFVNFECFDSEHNNCELFLAGPGTSLALLNSISDHLSRSFKVLANTL